MSIIVEKRDSDNWELVDSKKLKNGSHVLAHDGVKVPVVVKGVKLSVDVSASEGNLFSAELSALGGREGVSVEDLKTKGVKKADFRLKKDETGLHIYRDQNNQTLLVKRK